LERTKEIFDQDIYMVFGGFHLMNHSDDAVREIISRFKALGVKKCGATHCTGDRPIDLFRKAYGDDFVSLGVGKVLTFTSLP
jgi:7,8-dihydropterin-6-yl-methyl-4-(beta-D-ribofuranosyl)aminobenzene 5'-phosphate synthase